MSDDLKPCPSCGAENIEIHGWVRRERLDEAVNIAALALTALHEVQTYKQPDDPDEENALTMHELYAFDFDVDRARTKLAELEGEKNE
jgi:hypothetical protein